MPQSVAEATAALAVIRALAAAHLSIDKLTRGDARIRRSVTRYPVELSAFKSKAESVWIAIEKYLQQPSQEGTLKTGTLEDSLREVKGGLLGRLSPTAHCCIFEDLRGVPCFLCLPKKVVFAGATRPSRGTGMFACASQRALLPFAPVALKLGFCCKMQQGSWMRC